MDIGEMDTHSEIVVVDNLWINGSITKLGIAVSGEFAGWILREDSDGNWCTVCKFPIDPKLFKEPNIHPLTKGERRKCPNCSNEEHWIFSTEDDKIHVCFSCIYKWKNSQ